MNEQNLINSVCKQQSKLISKALDDKIIEALKFHGYEITIEDYPQFNHENDCEVLISGDLNCLSVNGQDILIWSNPTMDPFDCTKPFSGSFSFWLQNSRKININ